MTATTSAMDVVEVLRGTAAGPLLVAAGAVGGVAAVATAVAAVVWWSGGTRRAAGEDAAPSRVPATSRRDGVTVSLGLALTISVVEAALLVADGAGPGDRWLAVVATRVVVLAALLVADRDERRHRRPGLPGIVRGGLTLVLVTTAAMGAPATALSGRVWWATAVLTGLAVVVGLVWTVTVRAGRVSPPVAAVLLTVLLGGPVAVWTAPDAVPPHHQERVAIDDMVLDVTVAPVRAGTNEAHLYAFDSQGRPAPVTDVRLAVAGVPGSGHAMFEVSPDHHLSYVLELPADPPWTVSFTLEDADGRAREVSLQLDRP